MDDLLAVLAAPNRRRLLELLAGGEQSAGQLASSFDVTRSAISQHLGVLAAAGLVRARQEGRNRYYRLDPEGMASLRGALDQFWTRELQLLVTDVPTTSGGNQMAATYDVVVPLGPDETFAMLTEPERLRRWQVVTARVDLRAGGEFRWTVDPGHSAAGTYTEVEPGRRIVYTWGWEGSDELPPGASTVTVTLDPVDGGTRVTLVHEGLTDEQAAGHLEGWTHFLERLVVAATEGTAGPNEWAAAPDPMEPLSAAEACLAVCQWVLRGVGPDDGDRPTPCAKYGVDELIEHLVGSIVALGSAAGGQVEAAAPGAPAEERVAGPAAQALEAWRRRGVDGMVELGPLQLPAGIAAGILSIEFLVHAWDLAVATGQTVEVSEALSDHVLDVARQVIAPQMRDGDRFAEEIAAGPDASNLERLVAFTGRTA
jgi:uncharacterized protein (TIGR03086 family)